MSTETPQRSFTNSLLSGGMAGFTVDVLLFPLDTVKTRLQSSQGFAASGGFKGIYSGLRVAALGSVPGAAFFFSTYETMKHTIPVLHQTFSPHSAPLPEPVIHMTAAGIGELVACLVRVPTDVVKQRYQAKMIQSNSLTEAIATIYRQEGLRKGFYTGYFSTILRELPFSFIQFPLYEWMKKVIERSILDNERKVRSYEAAVCGSISGGIAAALTTPLDVIKTRLMLGKDKHGVAYNGMVDTIRRISLEANDVSTSSTSTPLQRQVRVFFAGLGPRVMWISIGGFIFFGAYEQSARLLQHLL
eukprot:gene3815-4075_t